MLHIHVQKDDKQGYVNTAERVCLTLGSILTPLLSLATLSTTNNLMRLGVFFFFLKRWKLFTLFITAVFYRAELLGHQRLVILTIDANKDGWCVSTASCCTAAKPPKPRRHPLPSCTDRIICGWSLSGGRAIYQDLSIQLSTQMRTEPSCEFWCLTLLLAVHPAVSC